MAETEQEHLNRNLEQLLQEMRVVLPGVQVLFGFLLAVPFAQQFDRVTDFQRNVYFVALLLAALSTVLMLALSIQHRILFHRAEKAYLIGVGNACMIAGMTAAALAITLSLVLVADFLFGTALAWVAGLAGFTAFALLWYAIPLTRRLRPRPPA